MTKGKIPLHMYPFYRVYDEKGNQYCDCGWEKHAQELIILNQTCSIEADRKELTYKRIDAPKPIDPETVDVNAETLPGDAQLKGQKILEHSEAQALEF